MKRESVLRKSRKQRKKAKPESQRIYEKDGGCEQKREHG